MIKARIILIILTLSFTGCSIYKEYPFESYERTKPEGRIEFLMNNNTVASFNSKQLELVKNTPENYIVYLKDGRRLELKKAEVKSVRMSDMKKFRTFMYITAGVLVGLVIGVFVILLNGFGS